jgi:hypothetical protein
VLEHVLSRCKGLSSNAGSMHTQHTQNTMHTFKHYEYSVISVYDVDSPPKNLQALCEFFSLLV